MCAPMPNLDHAVENLVDGAFFNSGQCCCGIERIYVHDSLYDRFVDGFVDLTRQLCAGQSARRGDDARTDGAIARFADWVRKQTARGARAGREGAYRRRRASRPTPATTAYLAPQVLTGVDHSMSVMTEESFGPVVGIMKVSSGRGGDPPDERLRPMA